MDKIGIKIEYDKLVKEINDINLRLVCLLNEVENTYGTDNMEELQKNKVWKQISNTRNLNIYKDHKDRYGKRELKTIEI